ncbi:PDF receptor-like [Pectinophora gossypiella]|uniref:G-protein coupled receptors family 2 profile 2 domain-containing protein n=1 Tax=Pectinophora gossypiella TaxID=13191 RepID=A0A1E1WRD2_PECGO|nr:PDF receptor-like [Pectinophora gossypiella]
MCGLSKLSTIIGLCLWICVGQKEVKAFFNDASSLLNPVKVDLDVWHQRSPRVASRTNENLACEKPRIYICEEVPDPVPVEARKVCNYRNQRFHEQVYRWVAGRGCLLYTPDFLYVGGTNTLNLNAGCFYGDLFAPCLEIAKDDGSCGCYPFDPNLEEVATAVRDALIPTAHGRWERCFYAATECCSHYMGDTSNYTVPSHCEATFDGWTCWPPAAAGSTATEICSEFAYSGQGPSCYHFSSKECYHNASWEVQTDYTTCSITPRLLRRYRFYIAVLSFSIVSCLPAVFVFFFYRRLRNNLRVSLHRNLLIAIIIRNILVIISRSEIYIDELTNPGETLMSTHGVGCRILAVAERAAANAVFVCMLVEGIYLHRLIVAVFKQKMNIKILYGVGAVITIAPVVTWAVMMGVYDDHSCWMVYTIPHVQWIMDGPRVAILLINTGLFIDVLRVLLTKIRNSENANQLNTAKATLFLMPIFGVQFLLTAFRPVTTDCTAEQIYYYVSYTVEGLQGFIVAMLYCYVNKEVHVLVKATYKKTESAVVSRVRRDSTYPRMSLHSNSERKMTYSTALPPNADELKDQYATIRPKLHVAEIISIQASERLAEILEPVYETIGNGISNEGYDSLERSDVDDDSGFIPNKLQEDYYGFTNASSISIDCQDWIRRPSPTSSAYSLNDYEAKYVGRKFANMQRQAQERREQGRSDGRPVPDYKNIILNEARNMNLDDMQDTSTSLYEDCENMLDEIMQYMENSEMSRAIVLDPSLLSSPRSEDDKVVFVDDVDDSSNI